ncbi:hypothetical protein AKJ62_04050 [candidate division MSBL1 archaeon SCGC-AAA259D14]|uniref:Uncharacterized protein n=1 Tax=candidate division MSBL1 archaeon SCGC-AAA259D14 TaxID=1698261 RepID=A0A133U473_9EURY|nr:hypothetical protein AKJ62_04050 [candidate division MSBL1 archaeon SCGC-AAA259D14]
MKVNELRRKLVQLVRRIKETHSWLQIMEELAENSSEVKTPQRNSAVHDELNRRFGFAYNQLEAFFQRFFEGEIKVKGSWKNQNKVVKSITRIATRELSGFNDSEITEEERSRLREESNRVFLYAKVFGPIKIPTGKENVEELYKFTDFPDWGKEAVDAAGFLNTWDDMEKTVVPLASEEDSFVVDSQSEKLIRTGAPEIVGSSEARIPVNTIISECAYCGRKLLSLGGGFPICSCERRKNPSEPEAAPPLAKEEINYPVLSLLDLGSSLHTGRVWDSSQEEAREIVAQRKISVDYIFNRYESGVLLSIFAGFLCIASGAEATPSNIARVATEKKYRNLLLEKAKGNSIRVANRLKKRENIRRIAVAFWS